jgi:hypothetical protein
MYQKVLLASTAHPMVVKLWFRPKRWHWRVVRPSISLRS